jgi:hypothetical protein
MSSFNTTLKVAKVDEVGLVLGMMKDFGEWLLEWGVGWEGEFWYMEWFLQ